jgi:hypothetical protein
MTMTMDSQQRHHLGSMGYDHMPYSAGPPHFTNPWGSNPPPHSSSHLFPTSLAASSLGYDSLPKPQTARTTTMSMPYSALPASAPPLGTGNFPHLPYSQSELLSSSQDLLGNSRSAYDQSYSSAPSQTTTSYATHPGTYAPVGNYGQSLMQQQQQQQQQDGARRLSQRSVTAPLKTSGLQDTDPNSSNAPLEQSQSAFGDALDGARGMVAMSQDITPRNIYGPRLDRSSPDSYGFPSTHSAHSSISSGSYGQYYTGSSAESSVTDYSSASESIDQMPSRTLPRPSGLSIGTMPPAPQSMMGSFNSKVSSNTQKKHKCKVCDKRFTRPSSLQTHMYSHTGEKRESLATSPTGRRTDSFRSIRLRSPRMRAQLLGCVEPSAAP